MNYLYEKFPVIKTLRSKTSSIFDTIILPKREEKSSILQIELKLIHMTNFCADLLEESDNLHWVSRNSSILKPLSTALRRKQSFDSLAKLFNKTPLYIELALQDNEELKENEDILSFSKKGVFLNEDDMDINRSPSVLLEIGDNIYRKSKPIIYTPEEMKFYYKLSKNLKLACKSEKSLKKLKKISEKKFIPPKLRGKIWPMLIKNRMKINKNLFKALNKRLLTNPSNESVKRLIICDIQRTTPTIHAVTVDSKLGVELKHIMELFDIYREDVGYIQGMVYLGLILLLHMDQYHTFKYFCNLIIENEFLYSLYSFNDKKRSVYLEIFDVLMRKNHPKIAGILEKQCISSDIYLLEWFFTLFGRAFDVEIVSKIWDLMLIYDLEYVIYKFTLTLFSLMENEIINCRNGDFLLEKIKSYPRLVEPNLFFRSFFQYKLKYDEFKTLLDTKMDDLYLKKLKL